ncbi:hypothetical protein J3R80_12725 [Aliiroseovarius sp. Z3]|uniref:hypothetical protein n=1 Tax=Aliiroseovarius sp. Z3 TaxID=2811402 RepID=UPI0023B28297|nr:hypothetical protein [Aliiroseovarius sp. Z3]MDE9451332.1 hypothetical protein [Aliiroseovarius sp. Z3]
MKKIVAFIGLGFLASCVATQTPYEKYLEGKPLVNYPYKAGASPANIRNIGTDCEIEAAQRVPQNIVVRTTPTYTTPTQTYCNRVGTQVLCNTTGGQTYGGQVSSYDANANLRVRAYAQCMSRRGVRFLNIPACPNGVDLSSQNNEKVLRPLSKRTCYQVYPNGGLAIGDG